MISSHTALNLPRRWPWPCHRARSAFCRWGGCGGGGGTFLLFCCFFFFSFPVRFGPFFFIFFLPFFCFPPFPPPLPSPFAIVSPCDHHGVGDATFVGFSGEHMSAPARWCEGHVEAERLAPRMRHEVGSVRLDMSQAGRASRRDGSCPGLRNGNRRHV